MRLLLNRRQHINMGAYEHTEVVATVEVDTIQDADLLKREGINVTDLSAVYVFLQDQVDALTFSDVEDAHMNTAVEDSFVHDHLHDLQARLAQRA